MIATLISAAFIAATCTFLGGVCWYCGWRSAFTPADLLEAGYTITDPRGHQVTTINRNVIAFRHFRIVIGK